MAAKWTFILLCATTTICVACAFVYVFILIIHTSLISLRSEMWIVGKFAHEAVRKSDRPGVGTWYHFTLNYLGNGGIQILLDGVVAGRDGMSSHSSSQPGTPRAVIGRKWTNVDCCYNSVDIDELYIYNIVLSKEQVQSLM